jgi:hypothetical protein
MSIGTENHILKFGVHGHHHGCKKLMLSQNPGNDLKKICSKISWPV